MMNWIDDSIATDQYAMINYSEVSKIFTKVFTTKIQGQSFSQTRDISLFAIVTKYTSNYP